jgi:hypothetical protein
MGLRDRSWRHSISSRWGVAHVGVARGCTTAHETPRDMSRSRDTYSQMLQEIRKHANSRRVYCEVIIGRMILLRAEGVADKAIKGALDRSVVVPALFRNPFWTKQSISVSCNVTRRGRRPL